MLGRACLDEDAVAPTISDANESLGATITRAPGSVIEIQN
jgi:hypothetical protein